MASFRITGVRRARLVKSSGGGTPTRQYTPIPKSTKVTWDPENDTFTYEGDGTKEEYIEMSGLKVKLAADYWDETLLDVLTAAATTTGLDQADEASRWYVGEASNGQGDYAIECEVNARKTSDNTAAKFRLQTFHGYIKQTGKYVEDPENKKKSGMMFEYEALKSTTNILNANLAGLPTGSDGAFFAISKLT